MILDKKVRAGTVVVCRKSRFGALADPSDESTLAVVLTPSERQLNRTFDAVPLTPTLPVERDVLNVRLKHEGLRNLSPTGEWFALCDRLTKLSLDSEDVNYLRRERGTAVNFEPRYGVASEDLKSIRLSMIIQLFPERDMKSHFGRSMRVFWRMASKLVLHKRPRRPQN